MEQEYIPKIYHFNIWGNFTGNLLENFTGFLNNISHEDYVNINLDSGGGETAVCYAIIKIINDDPDRFMITCAGETSSSALNLILMTGCKKTFLESFYGGIMHNTWVEMSTSEVRDKSDICTVKRLKNLDSFNQRVNNYFKKIGVPATHLKKVTQHQDVFLTKEEIIKISKQREKLDITFGN